MSTMGEIVGILAGIKKDLDAIDLTKEMEVKKIQGMATKPISEMDKAIAREDFEEEHLDAAISMFGEANTKVEAYDGKQDIEEAKKAKDINKMQEINDRMNARQSVKKSIQDKYQELSSKKAVLEKYKTKFNPKSLVEREEAKLEANNKKIEANKTRMAEIKDFKNKVSGELGVIKTNSALIKELEKLEKLAKDIADKENKFNEAKNKGFNKDLLAGLEEDLNNSKADLKTKTNEIAKKYKGVTLDHNNLLTTIGAAKVNATTEMISAQAGIEHKLNGSEKAFGYTDGFETIMLNKIRGAKPEEIEKIFDSTRDGFEAENINLGIENDKISENVDNMQRGIKVKAAGTRGTTNLEPTEAEIQAKIAEDSSIRALAPVLSEKDKTQKVFEHIKGGLFKNSANPILHPIASLRARFDKSARKNWEDSYNRKMRSEAYKAVKAAKEAAANEEKHAADVVDSKEAAFRKALFSVAKKADAAAIEQMDENADKAPGAVLVDVYNEMEEEK